MDSPLHYFSGLTDSRVERTREHRLDEQLDSGHGRVETRRCSVISALSMIEAKEEWSALCSLVKIESERNIKNSGKTEKETRLYISSLQPEAKLINQSVCAHWGVENSIHWVPDIGFNEDAGRKKNRICSTKYSLISRIALNLLKNETTTKVGAQESG